MGNCTEECIGPTKLVFFFEKFHPGRAMLNATPDARTEQCLTPWYMSDGGVVNASAACRFPFTYKRRAYWSCTTAGHAISWCATSYHNGLTKQVYIFCCGLGFKLSLSILKLPSRSAHEWGPCQPGCPGYQKADDSTCRTNRQVLGKIFSAASTIQILFD